MSEVDRRVALLDEENKRLESAVERLTAENATYRRVLEEIRLTLSLEHRDLEGFSAQGAVKKATADLHTLREYFKTFRSTLQSIKAHCQSGTTQRVNSIIDDILRRL